MLLLKCSNFVAHLKLSLGYIIFDAVERGWLLSPAVVRKTVGGTCRYNAWLNLKEERQFYRDIHVYCLYTHTTQARTENFHIVSFFSYLHRHFFGITQAFFFNDNF